MLYTTAFCFQFLRNHSFDVKEYARKRRKGPGDVLPPNMPSRGCRPVRQHHQRDESKILPHIRAGLQWDAFEK